MVSMMLQLAFLTAAEDGQNIAALSQVFSARCREILALAPVQAFI